MSGAVCSQQQVSDKLDMERIQTQDFRRVRWRGDKAGCRKQQNRRGIKFISEDALRRTVRRIRRKEKRRGDGAAAAGKRVYGDCEDCLKGR